MPAAHRCSRTLANNSAGDCGNCDVCLLPPSTWDATVAAQKTLSCVARTGQRFGPGHVIDVLLGKDTDKVQTAWAPAAEYVRHRRRTIPMRNGVRSSAN